MPKVLSLSEAAQYIGGGLKPRAIRRLIQQGRLAHVKLAGKYFVTPESIDAMLVNQTVNVNCTCRADASLPASSFARPEPIAEQSGPSSMDRVSRARAAALQTAKELKRSSKSISPGHTDHRVVPIGRNSSSSQKS